MVQTGGGEACCGADRGGVGIEEAVAVQIGAGLLLQMGGGHGSLKRRRWPPSVAAQPREKAALVASIAAALGDVKVGRDVLRGRRRRTRRAGLGTERVAGGNWPARWVRGGDP
jgi:hypothetical protein